MCTITDQRIDELSGLVTVPRGYVAVNDGSDDPRNRRIFFLDEKCKVGRAVKYPSQPTDTEDLAVAPDGTLWIADIGTNTGARSTIGLWKLAPGATKPVLHKVRYPAGSHDAETLILDGDGTPVIVTKEPFAGELFVPTGPLRPGKVTALRSAGRVRIPITTTSNPYGMPGRFALTGGTTSRDGTKVALRTYADAFEYPVRDGDVVGALTSGDPTAVPLPDEPQGEAIAYTQDGAALVTASEGAKPDVLRYPSALRAPSPTPTTTPPSVAPSPVPAAQQSPAAEFPTGWLAAGAGLLVVALTGIVLVARRRRP